MHECERGFEKVLYHYGLINETVYDKVKIVCPFHQDEKPSMQINIDTNFFYCYGCGAKGNVLEFIQKMENCSSLKAIVVYNKIIHDKASRNVIVKQTVKKSKKESISDAKIYFYSLPEYDWTTKNEHEALSYMLKRGFTRSALNASGARMNFNDEYPVIFPMVDNGKFKGYVSRSINKETQRKYLYNEGFSRRNTLVGNYLKDYVVICEGYMDWLKFKQYGINNCVAILGWKITDEQISKLQQKGITKVISALDNTDTGEKGTAYLKEYFDVYRFQFPRSIKDPGDLNKYQFNKAWIDTKCEIKRSNKNE